MTIYRPLRGNQIRLVHILFVNGQGSSSSDSVSCKLVTTTLENAGVFFALSYVWGDPYETSQILLHGEPFPVTVNLEHALRRLQSIIDGTPIWIDALSINQDDESERNKQVEKMHLIYGNAKAVIAWLGPGSDDCGLATKKFDSIGEQLLRSHTLEEVLLPDYFRIRDPAQSKLLMSHSSESEFPFDQTWALLQRPFWLRAWITQELYLAHSILFVCGEHSARWDRFLAAYYYLGVSCNSQSLSPDGDYQVQWSLLDKSVRSADFLLLGSFLYRDKTNREPLNSLLRTIRGRMHASDPRDMIYALLGIASDSTELHIEIEYHKTVAEVYMGVTRALISQGDLDVISGAQEQAGTRRKDLPSWVPDFSRGVAVMPFVTGFSDESDFSASADKPVAVSWDLVANPPSLSVSGVQIGAVDGLGRTWNHDLGASIEAIRAWLEDLATLTRNHSVHYKPNEAIWSTPIARSKAEQSNTEVLRRHQIRYEAYLKLCRPLELTRATDDDLNALLEFTEPFRYSMNRAAHMRRGFVTVGLLGLGPQATRQGDVICVLFGAKVPYVLRKLPNGSYKVIGDVYVFGLMYDELLKSHDQAEVFKLI